MGDDAPSIAYHDFLVKYQNMLLTLAESAEDGAAKLRVCLIYVSEPNITITDDTVDALVDMLQTAVDLVLAKLYGFAGFPDSVTVIAASLRGSATVSKTGDRYALKVFSESDFVASGEAGEFNYALLLSADADPGASGVSLGQARINWDPDAGLTPYMYTVFRMAAVIPVPCRVMRGGAGCAFLKSSCGNVSIDMYKYMALSDMDHAVLRQAWLLQKSSPEGANA
jgi:hypothetical protein